MHDKNGRVNATQKMVKDMLILEEKVRRLFCLDEERLELERRRVEIDEERRMLLKEIYIDQAARSPEAELAALSCYLTI